MIAPAVQVASEAGYAQIVGQYWGALHSDLKGLPAPAVDTRPPLNAPEQPKAAGGQLAGNLEGQVGSLLDLVSSGPL